MLLQAEIRANLIDRLAPIFGKPRDADFLAAELVKHATVGLSSGDLQGIADRLITTRKSKGFPLASELIEAVKSARRTGASASGTDIPGEIFFDGPAPMIWVFREDPRWKSLCEVAKRAGQKPAATGSKYAPGLGRFFNAEHVRGCPPANDRERAYIVSLYEMIDPTKEATA